MLNNTSQHILNTSANLLGFCLVVITSLHITNQAKSSYIDEFTSVVAILLILSCFFSFYSLRSKLPERQERLESIADYLFVTSLIGVLLIIIFLALNLIK